MELSIAVVISQQSQQNTQKERKKIVLISEKDKHCCDRVVASQ